GSCVSPAGSWPAWLPLESARLVPDQYSSRHDEQRAITKKGDNHDAKNCGKHVVICTVLTVHEDQFANAVRRGDHLRGNREHERKSKRDPQSRENVGKRVANKNSWPQFTFAGA